MTASDYRRIARQNLKGSWLISALVCFVSALLGGISSSGSVNLESRQDLQTMIPADVLQWMLPILTALLTFALISAIISFIIGGVIEQGTCRYFLNQHDYQNHDFRDLFSQFHNWSNAFLLRLLMGIYISLWTMLFIIPGIIKTYSYAMAPYIMAEHPEWSANECITTSRQMMQGHKLELFLLELSFIGWAILSIFTLGIGVPFLQAYIHAARAAFYRDL